MSDTRVLDEFDYKLLAAIQTDSNMTTSQLADAVGLSQAPCWRRLQRLREEGFVRGEVALLDQKKLGLAVQVFAHVKLTVNGRANLNNFTETISRHPEVLECHVLLGPVDCLLRIVVRDMDEYQRFFFDHLSPIPSIQEVNSMITLSVAKSTTALPLNNDG